MNSSIRSITIRDSSYSVDDFQKLSDHEKVVIMREWFLDNYEDPAENTPYDGKEGGYLFINGGPCDPQDELSVFDEFVDSELIESLADELSGDGQEWTNIVRPGDHEF